MVKHARCALAAMAFASVAIAAVGARTPDAQPQWAARGDYGRRLEPRGDRVLHGAGQSHEEFKKYFELLGGTKPVIYMTYASLRGYPGRGGPDVFFTRLKENLSQFGDTWLIPQIGLSMTTDGKPEDHYEHDVAAGKYDAQIEAFCRALKDFNRPVFIRIGYEFNGRWNGYLPDSYKAAWIRIVRAMRQHNIENAATAWCYHPANGEKQYMPYYPGDEWVDWWAIDLFAPSHFTMADTLAFVEEADRRGFPVMIGESTPQRIGVLDGEKSWDAWFAKYFDFIRRHRSVKAFCYISWEWSNYPKWKDWGNARIGDNRMVLERWRREMKDAHYAHGANEKELRNALGLK